MKISERVIEIYYNIIDGINMYWAYGAYYKVFKIRQI